ncbi:energy-coupling factor ABC transporter permease [Chromobacterium piscinae]|uniref:energy-coupling factor ABC transporter permease n=1 Tax=Chromobacterium piscinae TaxID=686831 RepID=UPI0032606CE7
MFTLLMGPWLAMLALAAVQLALAALFAGWAPWLAGALAAAALAFAAFRVRWRMLDPAALNAWMGACVLDLALWLLRGGLQPGLSFHLLGAALFNGFLAGGASLLAAALCGVLALGLAGAYPWDALLEEALPYYFLLSWSEAFTTGLLLAVLVVYKPRWVATFDDGRYLGGKPGPG